LGWGEREDLRDLPLRRSSFRACFTLRRRAGVDPDLSMYNLIWWIAIGAIAGTVYSSFFEWLLHRYLMHRGWRIFRYPFERHTLTHHRIFRADVSYHLRDEKHKHTVPMAWWNGPALIAVSQLPVAFLSYHIGQWGLVIGTTLVTCAYYGAYEYMHWCMHIPRKRNVERSGIFFRLNGHHLLHHRYMHKNFNVVLPLADLLLGTLLLRSKVHFAQARGPSLPDVQPRAAACA
jgi:hypothetical protein